MTVAVCADWNYRYFSAISCLRGKASFTKQLLVSAIVDYQSWTTLTSESSWVYTLDQLSTACDANISRMVLLYGISVMVFTIFVYLVKLWNNFFYLCSVNFSPFVLWKFVSKKFDSIVHLYSFCLVKVPHKVIMHIIYL